MSIKRLHPTIAFVTLCAGAQTAPNRRSAGRACRLSQRYVANPQRANFASPTRHHHLGKSIRSFFLLTSITGIIIMLSMIHGFKTPGTEDIYDGVASRAARKCCPQSIWAVARRKLDQINRVREVTELKVPPGNRLERLKGDRSSQYSIRINQQYRICFTWEEGHAYEVEITDYH